MSSFTNNISLYYDIPSIFVDNIGMMYVNYTGYITCAKMVYYSIDICRSSVHGKYAFMNYLYYIFCINTAFSVFILHFLYL